MQKRVYDCIKRNPDVTDKDIKNLLGLEINCVTPRRGELAKKGLVAIVGIRYSKTKKPNYVWRTT